MGSEMCIRDRPYIVALGKRNLLWDLLPDHIEEHVLEVDHAE